MYALCKMSLTEYVDMQSLRLGDEPEEEIEEEDPFSNKLMTFDVRLLKDIKKNFTKNK